VEDAAGWFSSLPSEWTEGCTEPLFATARQCYQSPGRVYHAWSHVVDCADKLRSFRCDSSRNVFLALLFHDAVYVPGNKQNEELSAELATQLLKEHSSVAPDDIAEISRFIRATQHHQLPPDEKSLDIQVTIDIDMSILGAAPDAYRAYADGVRREYCPAVTSEALFTAGRAVFLSNVLAQPAIFHTAEGVARWEGSARENMARELDALRAGQGILGRVASSILGWRQG
jgi:predicted metal-dependent HD superfamily phosphohydrolase